MRGAVLGLALLGAPAPVLAQAYQCSPPGRVEAVRPITADGPVRRTAIGGYTLAASWSPDYCKTKGDTASMQCSGRQGRFGFVLHGLWPEAARGPYPQWCGQASPPSPNLLRQHLCMTPSARLLAHEWAKHGTCMARSPAQYFKVAAILWRSIQWPDADRLSRREGLTARDVRRAFVAANPDWREDQVALDLGRNGWLRGVRLCYSRRFLPTRCERSRMGASDATSVKIWRGL